MPLDIIRNEHKALRDVLIKRVAKKAAKQAEVFQTIKDTSANLIGTLNQSVHKACPDVGSIRLATPTSWQDLIFAFGYKLTVKESEIDDVAQGSGIQSLLMFETLSLIDRDYFQKFGWRQAAIWAVEEPESSLHSSLEAEVANYLSSLAENHTNRLQIFCTTHSSLMLQYADQSYFVSMSDGQSALMHDNKNTVLEKASKLGISSWTHPALHYPLNPLILVEGKFDHAFLEQALKLLAPQKNLRVSYLELLQGGNVTGGVDELLKYVRAHVNAIKARTNEAPVIILLDWDAKGKKREFDRLFVKTDPCKVLIWPESAFNPKIDKTFRGIERHMTDRIINSADDSKTFHSEKGDGSKTTNNDDYGKLKEKIFKIVKQGITVDDLAHARSFLIDDLLSLIP